MNLIPYSEKAELYNLNDIIVNNKIDERITSDCFFLKENKELFIELSKNSNIEKLLEDKPLLESHVRYILGFKSPLGKREHYIELLLDNDRFRKILYLSEEIADIAYQKKNINLLEIQSKLNMLENTNVKDISDFKNELDIYIKNIDNKPEFIKTGFKELDNFLRLERSDLVVLAARPSMGKTAFQLELLINMAFNNHKPLAFSLEMKNQQLIQRVISNISNITLNKIKSKNLSDNEKQHLIIKMKEHTKKMNFRISDKNYSYNSIKKIIIKEKNERGVDVVLIDFLQLIEINNKKSKNDAYGEVTRNLKELAKELDILIIILSQLSRSVEMRADKKPILSDLRDSGEIEANVDTAIFLYRDEYYNENSDAKNLMEVIIRKQRQGGVGTAFLYYEMDTQKIRDLTNETR